MNDHARALLPLFEATLAQASHKPLNDAENSANAESSALVLSQAHAFSKAYERLSLCSMSSSRLHNGQMTLKIEKDSEGRKTIIRLSGRLRSEHLDQLKTQIDGDESRIALDLDGVTLVDVEVVRFLNACDQSGVEVLHCSPYIREWMIREKAR
jgi:hypothetical protein